MHTEAVSAVVSQVEACVTRTGVETNVIDTLLITLGVARTHVEFWLPW